MIRTGTLGTLPNGLLARTYTLTCKDVSVTLTNYGATLLKVVTPDKNKHPDDILLGYQNIKGYLGQNVACYGATIGPVANRSEFAQIMFNDRVATTSLNISSKSGSSSSAPIAGQPNANAS